MGVVEGIEGVGEGKRDMYMYIYIERERRVYGMYARELL